LLQVVDKKNRKEKNGKSFHYNFPSKNRRGLSEVISYILLIVVSIVMSVMVYQWLRTYVPTGSISCPDGTSIFLKNISYDCSVAKTLTLTIQNNGKFGIDGYFIHVSTNPNQSVLAIIDISGNVTSGGIIFGNSIRFSDRIDNSLSPEELHNTQISSFNIKSYGGALTKVEITPFRMQVVDNKKRVVSCNDAKLEETLICN
jgi:hypothetical protein